LPTRRWDQGKAREETQTMNLEEFDGYRHTIRTRSGEVSYVQVGSGRPVLFVHGVGTNALLWRNVIGGLATERCCVAIDLPLHGRTPAAPDADLSLPGLARFVADFCDELGLTGIDLVANDTGGAVAQIIAARQPDRLATFTLTNCEAHDNVPPPAFKPTVLLARTGLLALLGPRLISDTRRARKGLSRCYEAPGLPSDEIVHAFLEPLLGSRQAARQFQRMLTSLRAADLLAVEPDLKRLTVPTLVVWGTGDSVFPVRWAYWLRDTIPGVTEVVELSGARLFFPDERPAELISALRKHWQAHTPAPEIG